MSNLRESFESVANGPIVGAVIGQHYGQMFMDPDDEDYEETPPSGVLTWEVAKMILDYNYDSGYGGADCHPVYAWTDTQIMFVNEYDGSTSVCWLPRNPTNLTPDFL